MPETTHETETAHLSDRLDDLLSAAENARQLTVQMNLLGHPLDWGITPSEVSPRVGAYYLADQLTRTVLTVYLHGSRRLADEIVTASIESGENLTHCLKAQYLHHTQVGIFYSADVIILDGSDTGPDGDPTMEGHGSSRESGWMDPDYCPYDVFESREHVTPDIFDPLDEGEESDPGAWLSEQLRTRMNGVESVGGDGTFYGMADLGFDPYGRQVSMAAHPYGFTPEQLARARSLLMIRT